MNIQNDPRSVSGQSLPGSEPVVVIGNDREHVPNKDDGMVKTASEPLASFTMKCSKPKQG